MHAFVDRLSPLEVKSTLENPRHSGNGLERRFGALVQLLDACVTTWMLDPGIATISQCKPVSIGAKQPASAEIQYELHRKRIKSGIVKNPRSVPLRHRAEQR